jgi:hypothetical protein
MHGHKNFPGCSLVVIDIIPIIFSTFKQTMMQLSQQKIVLNLKATIYLKSLKHNNVKLKSRCHMN